LRIAAPKMLFAPVWCCRSCRSYRSCHFLVVFVAFLGDLCYLWLCVLINTFVRTSRARARVPWTSSKRNFLKNIPPSSFLFYIYCFSVVVHCRTVRQFRHRIYVRLPALIWSASSFVCHTVGTHVRPFPFAGLL